VASQYPYSVTLNDNVGIVTLSWHFYYIEYLRNNDVIDVIIVVKSYRIRVQGSTFVGLEIARDASNPDVYNRRVSEKNRFRVTYKKKCKTS